jgi:hypothetical protein
VLNNVIYHVGSNLLVHVQIKVSGNIMLWISRRELAQFDLSKQKENL